MAREFQGFQGQNPPYEQGNRYWGQIQIPYGQNPPLWGQNPYQQGWAPPVGPSYRPPMTFNTQLSFLATLEFPYVSRLTKDQILHFPCWPPVPSNILIDCSKFEGKGKEDPQAHVMTYHLSCSSNSYVDDSILLCFFQ